jgi:hypothetical protein
MPGKKGRRSKKRRQPGSGGIDDTINYSQVVPDALKDGTCPGCDHAFKYFDLGPVSADPPMCQNCKELNDGAPSFRQASSVNEEEEPCPSGGHHADWPQPFLEGDRLLHAEAVGGLLPLSALKKRSTAEEEEEEEADEAEAVPPPATPDYLDACGVDVPEQGAPKLVREYVDVERVPLAGKSHKRTTMPCASPVCCCLGGSVDGL